MVAVAVAGATAIQEALSDDGDDAAARDAARRRVERTGSTAVAGGAPIAHAADGPTSFRIRYRVANPGTVTTEDVRVITPFLSKTEVRRGDDVIERRETDLGLSVNEPAGSARVVLAVRPEYAAFRPGALMADAVAAGLVAEREQREVAGRRCQVYRTGAETGGTSFFPLPSTQTRDYVDLCVDEAGLVLELVEFFEGRVLRQRVATKVELDADIEPADLRKLDRDEPMAASEGGGSIRRIDPASAPVGPFLVLDQPPVGFEHIGRFEVVPPQPVLARPETRGEAVAGVADVYVRGGDVVVVERGARLNRTKPWELDDRYPDVDLGPVLGTGETLAGVTGGEVRALRTQGRFVRVYGTVSLTELTAVARALRATEDGNGPVYVDEPVEWPPR